MTGVMPDPNSERAGRGSAPGVLRLARRFRHDPLAAQCDVHDQAARCNQSSQAVVDAASSTCRNCTKRATRTLQPPAAVDLFDCDLQASSHATAALGRQESGRPPEITLPCSASLSVAIVTSCAHGPKRALRIADVEEARQQLHATDPQCATRWHEYRPLGFPATLIVPSCRQIRSAARNEEVAAPLVQHL